MFEFVNDNTLAEYEAFNMSHPFGHFAQSKKWANLKDNWKWEAVIVRDENGAICGSLAVLIRNLPHKGRQHHRIGRGTIRNRLCALLAQ